MRIWRVMQVLTLRYILFHTCVPGVSSLVDHISIWPAGCVNLSGSHTHKRRHTHTQCSKLFISMKIGRLMWLTMRTSHFISVHSRQITLFACFFFGYIVYSDAAEWPHDLGKTIRLILRLSWLKPAQQGAVRAAEHRLWKDTRKSAVAMLLGFRMLQWRWYLMTVLDGSFWRWGYGMMMDDVFS